MSTPHMRIETANRSLDVQRSLSITDGAFLRLKNHDGDAVSGHFSHADARRIGEWFATRYGLAPYAPKAGEVVRILPDAERYDGDEVDFPEVTRAKVISGPDYDGEYNVKALDGDGMGEAFYVDAAFIRHADAILPEDAKPEATKPIPAPRLAVGTPAVIVTNDAQGNYGDPANLPKGTPVVINGDMPSGSYRVTVHIDGALTTRYVRTTDVALSLPAEEPARPWAVGDEAIVTEGGKYADGFRTGGRVRLAEVSDNRAPDGTRQVRATSTERSGESWYTRTDALRRP